MSNLEPRFTIYGDVSIDSLPRIEINSNDGIDSLKKFCKIYYIMVKYIIIAKVIMNVV